MSTHDFKRGDLVYANGLPAVVYYVSPLQIRILMLKRGDIKAYRINRDRIHDRYGGVAIEYITGSDLQISIDSIMNFLHEIGEQKNETKIQTR